MKSLLRIANAQAFWGDTTEAASELMQQQPNLDYITLDYLSEVSLSIMAIQRAKDPGTGYARDFIDVVKSLVPFWKNGSKVKVISNAGGLEPRKCAEAVIQLLRDHGLIGMRVGIVSGDDVLHKIDVNPDNPLFNNLDTGSPIKERLSEFTTANAYAGASPIVKALKDGANIVITGRVADPSLTVAPCIAEFGWRENGYDEIAQATVAGHLIECGTQVTGGISNNWLDIEGTAPIGFPFVEISANGDFIVTKPSGSGGCVSLATVKEQLLYELGNPEKYLSPDATVSFLAISLEEVGKDRIAVKGAIGTPPPDTLKVSATYKEGYKAEATLAIFGRQARTKGKKCGEAIIERMRRAGKAPRRYCVECIGTGDLVPGVAVNADALECMLRVCVADPSYETVDYFTKQVAPMVCAGPAGTTGYTSGRARVRPIFSYWPCLIKKSEVIMHTEVLEV